MGRFCSTLLVTLSLALAMFVTGCGEREFHEVSSYSNRSVELDDKGCEELRNCAGGTAGDAKEVAKKYGVEAKYFDPYGTGLTDQINGEGSESIRTSTVIDVEVHKYTFTDSSVWFTLSYVDASNESQEPKRKIIEAVKGGTPKDAKAAASETDYDYVFMDSEGEDITSVVWQAKENSPIGTLEVEKAEVVKGLFGGYTAVFKLPYSDSEWLDSLQNRSAKEVCDEYREQSTGSYYLSSYPVRADEEKITEETLESQGLVVKTATRSLRGSELQVVSPEYWETETALSKKLSAKKAKKAAKKYVKKVDNLYSVDAEYAEALDKDTWLITGSCREDMNSDDVDDPYCQFTCVVIGTNSKPKVVQFDYKVVEWNYSWW